MIISKNNVIQPEELPITDNITISQKDSEDVYKRQLQPKASPL